MAIFNSYVSLPEGTKICGPCGMAWPLPRLGSFLRCHGVWWATSSKQRNVRRSSTWGARLRSYGSATAWVSHGFQWRFSQEKPWKWTEIATCLVMKNCWKWTFPTFGDGDFPLVLSASIPKTQQLLPWKCFIACRSQTDLNGSPCTILSYDKVARARGVDPNGSGKSEDFGSDSKGFQWYNH